MKKLTYLFLTVLLLVGINFQPIKAQGVYVKDETGDLTSEQVTELNQLANDFSDTNNVTFMAIITNEVGDSIEDYATNYFNENKPSADGAILVVDLGNMEYVTLTFGTTADKITEERMYTLNDSFTGYLNENDWYSGIKAYLNAYSSEILGTNTTQTVEIPTSNGKYVDDQAELLSDEEESTLQTKIQAIRDKYQYDVVIVTNQSTGTRSAMQYADDYFDYNGYGYGTNRDGMLFLVTFQDNEGERTYWTSTHGYGLTAFTDYGIEKIGEDIEGYLRDGDYYDAFTKYLELVPQYLDAAKAGTPYDVDNQLYTKEDVMIGLGIGAVVGILVASLVVFILASQLKNKAKAYEANNYQIPGSFELSGQADIFLYSHTSSIHHERSSGGGGGGGSSSHFSSSGSSHGGGGGHF